MTVFGESNQTRSFCYVDHLIEGLTRLMAAPDRVVGPMNLGNPHEITIRELAEKAIAMAGESSEIVSEPLPEDHPVQHQPDISSAERVLDWSPQVPLDTGLQKTFAYFKRLRAENSYAEGTGWPRP